MSIPTIDRFMAKVNKTETCWLWTGTTSGSNAKYGYFWSPTHGKKIPAHRWSYEHFVGQIPDGCEIDHVAEWGCTSKLCVNPAHLEPVTHTVNRNRSRLTVCRAGLHDLTDPHNQRWDTDGNRRGCAGCHRDKARARYAWKVSV